VTTVYYSTVFTAEAGPVGLWRLIKGLLMGSLLNQDCIHICVDNISWLFSSRFPATSLMSAATVLVQAALPEDPLWRSWGGMPVQTSCLHWRAGCQDCRPAYFSMHKQGKAMTTKLRNCVQILQVLPMSSAACERGFSQINRPHTAVRNRLAVTILSDLLIISINGPYLRDWNVDKYVLSWLKTGRHGALDKLTGKSSSRKEPKEGKKAAKLFAWLSQVVVYS